MTVLVGLAVRVTWKPAEPPDSEVISPPKGLADTPATSSSPLIADRSAGSTPLKLGSEDTAALSTTV